MAHPMMAKANHDERAGQLFTRDLKAFVAAELNGPVRELARACEARRGAPAATLDEVGSVFAAMLDSDAFRTWIALKRMAQEMMWHSVGETVDRELDQLNARARLERPRGTLTLDPNFEAPAYVLAMDTHLMPGGYMADDGPDSIRQGALMDAGGQVYQLGRPMGPRNDRNGWALVTHLIDKFPDLNPRRILDLGTGVGRAAVAAASAFPEAEVFAVDVGAAVLRYAFARAEHLGVGVHFSQQNAEHTDFKDGSFDLVISSAIFHETSEASIPALVRETYRLLRPGGVCINLEVPCRYWEGDLLGRLEAEWETLYNNESAYRAAVSVDFEPLFRASGFSSWHVGWQQVTANPGERGFSIANPSPTFALYVAAARK